MALSVGIVGLPNVGKSTLFNAITKAGVPASNFPFCTIDPNVGIVNLPDSRLDQLAKMNQSEKTIPATLQFTDIAGLVKGASQGEGLGNKFLSHIRETEAIAHVVRCFEDDQIIHVDGSIDPERDIETIKLELIYADLQTVEKRIQGLEKKLKSGDPAALELSPILQKVKATLEKGELASKTDLSSDEKLILKRELPLLTQKPVIYVANIAEKDINDPTQNPRVKKVIEIAARDQSQVMWLSSKIEAELAELDEASAQEMLKDLGIEETGIQKLSKLCFKLLGLQTYLTSGPKETRAWTIHQGWKAPQAAGVIHTDFEKKFIKAEVVSFEDFLQAGSIAKAREMGKLRLEGKDYLMHEGDIVEFKVGG